MSKTQIKAKFNHTKKNWQVVFRTGKGAWEAISNLSHDSKHTAEAMVDWYADTYPNRYTRAE